MQRDMHFYAVYALARAAGIKAATAHTIACASQFVDDAGDDDVVSVQNATILSIMTSHKSLSFMNAIPGDQWRVWVPFHFLPGNEPKDGSFSERMLCRKDSEPARTMKTFALDPKNRDYWPHLIGIVSHVYADTFSHFGFTGYSCDANKVREYSVRITGEGGKNLLRFLGKMAKNIGTWMLQPFVERVPVGHGSVGLFPDHPCISWTFRYAAGEHRPEDTDRNNREHYLEACERLHEFFGEYLDRNPADNDGGARPWHAIAPIILSIMQGGSSVTLEEREQRWRDALSRGAFCAVTDQDAGVRYVEDNWDLEQCAEAGDPRTLGHARAFIRAAFLHRDFVLHQLLPQLGLITY